MRLKTLLIAVSLLIPSCQSLSRIRVYSIQEHGLVRAQAEEVIPFEQAYHKFGCVHSEDMRTIVELIQACQKKTINFESDGVRVYVMLPSGLISDIKDKETISYADAVGRFMCMRWADIRTVLEMIGSCEK